MLQYHNIAMCLFLVCYGFMKEFSCSSEQDVTNGDIFLQKFIKGEALTNPPLLIFTAPSKLCMSDNNSTCRGKKLALSFPLVIGEDAAQHFQKQFPRKTATLDAELTARPTFTTSIKYCLQGTRCLQTNRRRSTPLHRLSIISQDTVKLLKKLRARRSILNHPENFLDIVTGSVKPQLTTSLPEQPKDHFKTTFNTPHMNQNLSKLTKATHKINLLRQLLNNTSSNIHFKSRKTTLLSNNTNVFRVEPNEDLPMKRHSKLLKKVTDLFGYPYLEPYKHLEYPRNKTQKSLSMQYKKNIKKYLEKLQRNKYNKKVLLLTGEKSKRRMAGTIKKFIPKNNSRYAPIKGRKTNDQGSDYDEHHIRNSADVSKENFEEMSLPDPDNVSDREVSEVKRIQRERVPADTQQLKRFKIKDNNNNDVKTGNSKEAALNKKPPRIEFNKKKKGFGNKQSSYIISKTENPITKKPKVKSSTTTYKSSTNRYTQRHVYKKMSTLSPEKPYRDSTKQTTELSVTSTAVILTPHISKLKNRPKSDIFTENQQKYKNKLDTVSQKNKITTKKPFKEPPREPYYQPTSQSDDESDTSETDDVRIKPLLKLLNPSSSERQQPKKHKEYVSGHNKLRSSSGSIGESESRSDGKLSHTSGSGRDTDKKINLKNRPEKGSNSESSEITDTSVDAPISSSDNQKEYWSYKNKMRSKTLNENILKNVLRNIPPNDHNKYIPYVNKLVNIPSSNSPIFIESTTSVIKETQTEIVPKKVKESDTEIQQKITSSSEISDNDNDKVAEILRDLLRESHNSRGAPDIIRIPNEIKIRKSKHSAKTSRNKHPEVYIMVV